MTKKCLLEINDEVNAKFHNLEVSDRRQLVKKFEFEVPGAKFLPSVRLGRWNGKKSFFSLGGSTFINCLPEALKYLVDQGYDIELVDNRDYQTSFEFDLITEDTLKHKTWPAGHALEGQPIVPRSHQIEVANAFLQNPQSLVVAATGAGKTLITGILSLGVEKYGRSIVIVPNTDLVNQTFKDYDNLGLDVGVFYGAKKDLGKKHTICTWQSLNSMLKNTLKGEAEVTIDEFLEDVVCVIVDEVHGLKADALQQLLTTVMAKIPIRWGLTGTIPKSKMDFMALKTAIGDVVHTVGAAELQEIGVLSNLHIEIMQMQDNQEFGNYQTELKFLMSNIQRMGHIAQIIADNISKTGNTLVLVDRLEAGKLLQDCFEELNKTRTDKIDAIFISGDTKSTDRVDQYDDMVLGGNKVLIATYGIAAVGLNILHVNNLVLIEPGKSFVRVIQSIGRGLRRSKDKDFVTVYDITSTCKFAKRHLRERKKYYDESQYPHSTKKINYKK
jgi:superfamily II DNA or RNA helicase